MYISYWVYFVTYLNWFLQRPLTAWLAKTKADVAKQSSYCYSSCCVKTSPNQYQILLNSAHRRTWLEGLCFLCIQKETGAKEIKERADFDILMYGKPYIVLWEIWPTQVYANQQVEYIAEAFFNFFFAYDTWNFQIIHMKETNKSHWATPL